MSTTPSVDLQQKRRDNEVRGRHMAAAQKVKKTDEGFAVEPYNPGTDLVDGYRVWRDTDGRVKCDCGDFYSHQSASDYRCEHIFAVMFHLQPPTTDGAVAPPAQPAPPPPVQDYTPANFAGGPPGAPRSAPPAQAPPPQQESPAEEPWDEGPGDLDPLDVLHDMDSNPEFAACLKRLSEALPQKYIKEKAGYRYIAGEFAIFLLNERAFTWEFFPVEITRHTVDVVPPGWSEPVQVAMWQCRGNMTIHGVTRGAVGSNAEEFTKPPNGTDWDALANYVSRYAGHMDTACKGSETDCMKRCARYFGLALELYLNKPAREGSGGGGGGGSSRQGGGYAPATRPDDPWCRQGDDPLSDGQGKAIYAILQFLNGRGGRQLDPDTYVRELWPGFTGGCRDISKKAASWAIDQLNKAKNQ